MYPVRPIWYASEHGPAADSAYAVPVEVRLSRAVKSSVDAAVARVRIVLGRIGARSMRPPVNGRGGLVSCRRGAFRSRGTGGYGSGFRPSVPRPFAEQHDYRSISASHTAS